MSRNLVAYFSVSGVTKKVAKQLAEAANCDLYEIRPEIPYTDDDLNWMDKKARSTVEMNDKAFRPATADKDANIADYDLIFVGFPIWWYVAPTIINTFLESYDFSGKTVVLFATSGGSGFGKTVEGLRGSVDEMTVIQEGGLLNGRETRDELKKWIQNLEKKLNRNVI